MIPKHAIELINAIRQSSKKLTKWEEGFLSTINIQAKQDRIINDKQAKALQEIYSRISGGGLYQTKEFIGGR